MKNKNRDDFWNEICGTQAFKDLGLNIVNKKTLNVFDDWYMNKRYSYLSRYLPFNRLSNKDVLEIGLGFGTVGERLFLSSKQYTGIDYSNNPIKMMEQRISWNKKERSAKALLADAKNLPFKAESFDYVVSIGCLHHTGDIKKCVDEIYRVLNKNGKAIIMLYSKNSFRFRIVIPIKYFVLRLKNKLKYKDYKEFVRSKYDRNSKRKAAPITEFSSKKDIIKFFSRFKTVSIQLENYGDYPKLPFFIKKILTFLSKMFGKDFYIVATK